ncbi:hypothetical protein RMR16_020625 [Agrobacterium sp. rho-13.3]|jgi:hypothetical protein|uniref:hypothetical protein n=1 Tax=Agrobacterium sp. rho-13.3 TaxID=3072980 RepID=UPI002A0ADD35|nr:hypothetical protein [Agrobacterium sp. rho-13.3]MDX8306309.1 hypothetical protein [Agrobacterium sp. rho-13.3]MDX8307360.1 hypothetical protein [Agrobacterium sp. rho-13.3]
MNEDFWKTVEDRQSYSEKSRRIGVLNVALLFGMVAIALSLIVTPMLAGKTPPARFAQVPDNFDMISTGSINRGDQPKKSYSIRRSVTQPMPGAVCIVEGYANDRDC